MAAAALAGAGTRGAPRPPLAVVVHIAAQTDLDPLLACAAPACRAASCPAGARRRGPASRRRGARAVHAAALAACARRSSSPRPGAAYFVPALPAAVEAHAPGCGLAARPAPPPRPLAQLARPAGPARRDRLAADRRAGDEWLAAATARSSRRWSRPSAARRCWPAPARPTAAAFSPAQLVLDAETWSTCATIARGIAVDDETIALDTIAADRHRRQRPRPAAHAPPHEDVWRPRLFDRGSYDVVASARAGGRGASARRRSRRAHRRPRGAAARGREARDASAYHRHRRFVIRGAACAALRDAASPRSAAGAPALERVAGDRGEARGAGGPARRRRHERQTTTRHWNEITALQRRHRRAVERLALAARATG